MNNSQCKNLAEVKFPKIERLVIERLVTSAKKGTVISNKR